MNLNMDGQSMGRINGQKSDVIQDENNNNKTRKELNTEFKKWNGIKKMQT